MTALDWIDMRLLRFRTGDTDPWTVGIDLDGELRDATPAVAEMLGHATDPFDPLPEALGILAELQASAESLRTLEVVDADVVQLGTPMPRPGKLLCVGLNYADHAEEAGMAIPEVPEVFAKTDNAIIGPGEAIRIPEMSYRIDYEGEIAVVIGSRGRNIPVEDASSHIGGYTLVNDVTARDVQVRSSQWLLAKSFDTFAPIGPAIYLADESEPVIDISVTVNEEQVQGATSKDLIFGFSEIVHYLSRLMTLNPGDVIATGTPSGVGFLRNPRRYIRDGDVVTVSSTQIGALTNPVRADYSAKKEVGQG